VGRAADANAKSPKAEHRSAPDVHAVDEFDLRRMG